MTAQIMPRTKVRIAKRTGKRKLAVWISEHAFQFKVMFVGLNLAPTHFEMNPLLIRMKWQGWQWGWAWPHPQNSEGRNEFLQ
jgi:hypothetical protein